uniref:molecular chaperone HtpG n=1 Tax=Lachnospira sp. TaxID=2049031 RepID=UPI004026079F
MANTHGSLSINSDNIFPIIKKWMYSDHDIFYRELISNGCDAITKLKKLDMIGEYEAPEDIEYKIDVKVSANNKTIKIIDNGIGMTSDEVEQYINQIAFSGAEAFLEKYKDKANDDQIIGHFGLGFYSAFMVADKVTIDTLSFKEGSKAVHWECDGGTEYDMADGTATAPGTTITLYLNEDSYEFANEYKAREVIEKYCSFMPIPIFLTNEDAGQLTEEIPEDEVTEKDTVLDTFIKDAVTEEVEKEDGTKETVEKVPAKKMAKIVKRPVALNDIHPLWTKHPNECTSDEYKEFYRKVFNDYKEPLFWIHLNMDYPFNLKGILYFPKINTEYESIEGTIKLYNNQVFVADNIKEVIPEFLLLLKGVIDCPDLPLNVSRSALQNDGFVKKISDYITKKVADKLTGMCKTDRENYEKYQYINMCKKENLDAIILTHNIDQPFITHLEGKNEGLKFARIDTDLSDIFKEETNEDELKDTTEALTAAFKKALNNDNINIKVEKLKDASVSSMITLSEQDRRMQDMMKMYGMSGMDPAMFGSNGQTLVLNANNELVKYIVEHKDGENTDIICQQLYDLALISHAPLAPAQMTAFIQRSNKIMELLAK